jgi:hypothetical protein
MNRQTASPGGVSRIISVALLVVAILGFIGIPVSAQHTEDIPVDSLGYLVLSLPTDSAFIVVDGDFARPRLITPSDSLLPLPTGERHLLVASRTDRDFSLSVYIKRDTTHVVGYSYARQRLSLTDRLANSSYPRIVWNANLVVHTDPYAEIYVGREVVGTGVAHVDLAPGVHRVTTVDPEGRARSRRVTVTDDRMVLSELYLRPYRPTYRLLAIVPGGSQFYRGQRVRGSIAATVVAGLSFAAVRAETDVRDLTAEFEWVSFQYRSARSETTAWEFGNRADALYEDIGLARQRRNVLIGAAVGAYVVQVIDAIRRPPNGFRSPRGSAYLFEPVVAPDGAGVRLRIGAD